MVLTGTHVINDTGHTADHNLIDTAINAVSSVPIGGTAGQVLKKNTSANGDTSWATPASVEHTAVPLASSGSGTPGAAVSASANDHIHPASSSGGAGGVDANMAVIPASTSSGQMFPVVYGGQFNTGDTNKEAHAYPCRVSTSGTFFFGLEVTTAAAASSVRLAIFADNATGTLGTLVLDTGQIDASTTGQKFGAASVTLTAGTRYWFVVSQEGSTVSAVGIRVGATPSMIAVGITGNNTYPGNNYRLSVGPYASNQAIIIIDSAFSCPCFLLRVP